MREKGFRVITNMLAFFVIVFIAISLVVGKIAGGIGIATFCAQAAKISAYVLVGLSSFWYVMSKRSFLIKCLWLISVVVIVVMLIL